MKDSHKSPLIDAINKQSEYIKLIVEQVEMVNDITPSFFREIQDVENGINYVDRIMKSATPHYELNETFEKIRRGFEQTDEDMKLFQTKIVELGYPPHYDVDIRQMRIIIKDYREDKKQVAEYIDEFMAWNYNSEAIHQMLIKWETKPFLEKRLHILRNVVKSHNQGMYHLSVLGIVSQYEGLIVDAFGITGRVSGKNLENLLEYLLKQEKKNNFDFDNAIFDYYKSNILVSFRHGEEIGSSISRHAILHGAHTNFGTLSISIKVILLFDYLVDAIDELTEEVVILANQEIKRNRERNNKTSKAHIGHSIKQIQKAISIGELTDMELEEVNKVLPILNKLNS